MVWLKAILGKLQNPEGGSLYEAPDPSKIDDPSYMNTWRNTQKSFFNKALSLFGCKKIIIRNASHTNTWIDSNLEHSNYPVGYLRYDSTDNNYITQNSVSTNNGLVLILEFDDITDVKITCNSIRYPSLENNSLAIFANYNDVNTYNITWGEDRNPHLFKGTDDESVDSFQIGFTNPYFRETIDNEIINVNEFLYLNLNRAETHTIIVSKSGTPNQKIILDGNHIKDEEKYNYLRIAIFDNDIVSITYEKLENGTYNIPSTEYLNSALMMPSNFAYRFDNSDLSSLMLDNVMEREEHSRHQSNVENQDSTRLNRPNNPAQNIDSIHRYGVQSNALNMLQNKSDNKYLLTPGQFYNKKDNDKDYKYLKSEIKSTYLGFTDKLIILNDEFFYMNGKIYRKNKKDKIVTNAQRIISRITWNDTDIDTDQISDVFPEIHFPTDYRTQLDLKINKGATKIKINIQDNLVGYTGETKIKTVSKKYNIYLPNNSEPNKMGLAELSRWDWSAYSDRGINSWDGGIQFEINSALNFIEVTIIENIELPTEIDANLIPDEPISQLKYEWFYSNYRNLGKNEDFFYLGCKVDIDNIDYYKDTNHPIELGMSCNLIPNSLVYMPYGTPFKTNKNLSYGFHNLKTESTSETRLALSKLNDNNLALIPNDYKDSNYLYAWFMETKDEGDEEYCSSFFDLFKKEFDDSKKNKRYYLVNSED